MRSASPFALPTLALLFVACGGPPGRPSEPLAPSGMALPEGAHAIDLRATSPAFALASATGEEEVHDLSGRIAPPIPGHEREPIRGLRVLSRDAVWACVAGGPAVWNGTAWTFLDLPAIAPRGLDPAGSCDSIDARAVDEMYLGWGHSVCAWEFAEWDCFEFAALAEQVTLTDTHVWFVQTPSRYDDLLVVDTVTRATPTLIRLGDADTTGHVLPVPGAEQVTVTRWAGARDGTSTPCDACAARTIDTEGNVTEEEGEWVVPLGPDERFVLSVLSSGPLACGGGLFPLCAAGDAWSQLVVTRVTPGASTEVGHLAVTGTGGVPAWALRDADGLLVSESGELMALP